MIRRTMILPLNAEINLHKKVLKESIYLRLYFYAFRDE